MDHLDPAFDVVEPADDTPVLVEVPHAGMWVDAEAATWTAVPTHCLARDADLYVDELFADAPELGATLQRARMSRFLVDLNRGEDDYDRLAVEGGSDVDRPRGVIWRVASDGSAVLRDRLPRSEWERRMDRFHRPYHRSLRTILDRKRERFGFAVMICAHSMPTPRRSFGTSPPADVVPGTRGRTSAADRYIDLVDTVARERGWKVRHDVPYRGGYATGHYGRPDDGVHAVQVELARRLYMDERSLARTPDGFEATRGFARDLVQRMVAAAT